MLPAAADQVPIGWEAIRRDPHILQPGDILQEQYLLWPLSWLVRLITRERSEVAAWASHSAMVHSVAGNGVRVVEIILRVAVKPIGSFPHYPFARIVAHRKPGGLSTEEQIRLVQAVERHLGEWYNLAKPPAHVLDRICGGDSFRRRTVSPRHPICSTLVANAFSDALGVDFGIRPDYAEPDTILDWCVRNGWQLVWASSEAALRGFNRAYARALTACVT